MLLQIKSNTIVCISNVRSTANQRVGYHAQDPTKGERNKIKIYSVQLKSIALSKYACTTLKSSPTSSKSVFRRNRPLVPRSMPPCSIVDSSVKLIQSYSCMLKPQWRQRIAKRFTSIFCTDSHQPFYKRPVALRGSNSGSSVTNKL